MRAYTPFTTLFAFCVPASADWRDRAATIEHHDVKAIHSPLFDEEFRAASDLACWKPSEPGEEDGYFGDGWKYQNWLPTYVGALDSIGDSSSSDCLKCFSAAYYGRENRRSSFLAVDKLPEGDWGVALSWDLIDFISNGEVKKGEAFNVSIMPTDIANCGVGPYYFEEYSKEL